MDGAPQGARLRFGGRPGLAQHRRDAELRCPAEDADNWQRAPGQRAEILRPLALSTAPAVALVSGDAH